MKREELTSKVEELEVLINTGRDDTQAELNARELLNFSSFGEDKIGGELYRELHSRILLVLSESLWQRGMAIEALPIAEEALVLAEQTENKELQAKAQNNIGLVSMKLSDYPRALQYYDKALALGEELGNITGVAAWTGNIGLVYVKLSDYPRALEYYAKALALNEKLGNKNGVATWTGNIGLVYTNTSDYPRALEHYSKALALFEELGNKNAVAVHSSNIGVIYDKLSDYSRALEYYSKSLAFDEELGDKRGVAINTGNLGIMYQHLSDYPHALEYYNKSLALLEELGDKASAAIVIGNIGNVHRELDDYPRALEYYGKALALLEELGMKAESARTIGNIGNVYRQLSDFPRALEYFGKALAVHNELGDNENTAIVTGNIGILYSLQEFEDYNPEKAEKLLLKALAEFTKLGVKKEQYEFHKHLADLYKTQGRMADAFNHFEQYHDLKEQVQSQEAKKQVERLDYERKTAEREKQIAVERAKHEATEELLHNVLPQSITKRLLGKEKPIADKAENVSVFFSDIVGFTSLSQKISAKELVTGLNDLFTKFDALAKKHNIEKIKTIGDAYMAVCGVPVAQVDHAMQMSEFALSIRQLFQDGVTIAGHHISIRIGLHCGEVVAGVIGENKFAYDLWGDAVNTASRMESHGEAGKIHVTEEFKHAVETLHATSLQFIRRGEMDIKGKGIMKTYFLEKNINT
jgi:class 3 adenylate cyclase/Tfp pilus assembly protein PilF